jgi:hypothetical protein
MSWKLPCAQKLHTCEIGSFRQYVAGVLCHSGHFLFRPR